MKESPARRFIQFLVVNNEELPMGRQEQLERELKAHGYRKFWFEREDHSAGCQVIVHQTGNAIVEIKLLAAFPSRRGVGTEVLRSLCSIADDFGLTLWLEAQPIALPKNIKQDVLQKMYSDARFVQKEIPSSWRNSYYQKHPRNFEHPMIREPRRRVAEPDDKPSNLQEGCSGSLGNLQCAPPIRYRFSPASKNPTESHRDDTFTASASWVLTLRTIASAAGSPLCNGPRSLRHRYYNLFDGSSWTELGADPPSCALRI